MRRRRGCGLSTRAALAWVGGSMLFVVLLSVVAQSYPLLAFVLLVLSQLVVLSVVCIVLTRGRSAPAAQRPRLPHPPPPRLWPGVHERGMVVVHDLKGSLLQLGCLGDEGTFSVQVDVSLVRFEDLLRLLAALRSASVVTVEVGGAPAYASLVSPEGTVVAPASQFLVGRDRV